MSAEPHGDHEVTESERIESVLALRRSADPQTHISPAFEHGSSANSVIRRALGMDDSPASQKRATYILQLLRQYRFIRRIKGSYRVELLPSAYAVSEQRKLGLSDYEAFTETLRKLRAQVARQETELAEYRAENEMLWDVINRHGLAITPDDVARVQFHAAVEDMRRHDHGA